MDKDNSGTIDFNEFCEMMSKQESTIPEAELKEVFNLFDKYATPYSLSFLSFLSADRVLMLHSDHSGTISEVELLKVMQQLLGSTITAEEVSKMMKEADKVHS